MTRHNLDNFHYMVKDNAEVIKGTPYEPDGEVDLPEVEVKPIPGVILVEDEPDFLTFLKTNWIIVFLIVIGVLMMLRKN